MDTTAFDMIVKQILEMNLPVRQPIAAPKGIIVQTKTGLRHISTRFVDGE